MRAATGWIPSAAIADFSCGASPPWTAIAFLRSGLCGPGALPRRSVPFGALPEPAALRGPAGADRRRRQFRRPASRGSELGGRDNQIVRVSCRERVCQYVEKWVVAVEVKKKKK